MGDSTESIAVFSIIKVVRFGAHRVARRFPVFAVIELVRKVAFVRWIALIVSAFDIGSSRRSMLATVIAA